MKKTIFAGFLFGLFTFAITGVAGAALVVTYTDFSSWEAASGTYQLENFNDGILSPELSFVSDSKGRIKENRGEFYFLDKPTKRNDGTTWSFSDTMFSFGGDWQLSGGDARDAGLGLLLTISDGSISYVAPEISRETNNFWGFTSDTGFTSLTVSVGSQGSWWDRSENHRLDNMVYGIAPGGAEVPEPATMLLFGTGLAGLVAGARRKKK